MSKTNGSTDFIRNTDRIISKRASVAPKKDEGLRGLLQRTGPVKGKQDSSVYDTAYMIADIVASMRKGNNNAS